MDPRRHGGTAAARRHGQYAIQIWIYRGCFGTSTSTSGLNGLCPGDTENYATITLGSGATVFDQTIGPIRVKGRVVSSIAANVWTFGLKDLHFTVPALPEVGAVLSAGDVTSYSVNVSTSSFAGFTVPFDGKNATTTVVTKRSANFIYPRGLGVFPSFFPINTGTWSGRLQSIGNGGPGDALTSNLLAGDEITVYGALASADINANVIPEFVSGDPGTFRVASKTEDRNPSCMSGPEPAAGYDCTSTLEIFTPRVIPSTLATTCASDITGDGVVNFADLAKMKSVFFKTCTP